MSDQNSKCNKENMISQLLKVQAQITVTPLVEHGDPKVYCIKSCIKPNADCCNHECYNCCDYDYDDCGCDCYSDYYKRYFDYTWNYGKEKSKCNFTLTQVICVEIPISFDADVEIKDGIVCCGSPTVQTSDDSLKRINLLRKYNCF